MRLDWRVKYIWRVSVIFFLFWKRSGHSLPPRKTLQRSETALRSSLIALFKALGGGIQ